MKIVYLTRRFVGHDLRFIRGYRADGCEVVPIALAAGATDRIVAPVVLGVEAKPDWERASADFSQLVARENPDVVVAGPLSDAAFVASRAHLACPWIAQSWAFDVLWEAERDANARQRVVAVLNTCDALFADCEAVVRASAKLAGSAPRAHIVVPWGLERDGADEARPAYSPETRPQFLYTRGFDPIYAPEVLIEAWTSVARHARQPQLTLAGDGALRRDVEQLAAQLGAGESLRFLGSVDHATIEWLFRTSDFYVSTALCDGTSISLLEAMDAGAVPIVSDVGGNSEWVTTGRNGWRFAAGNVPALAAALAEALTIGGSEHGRMAAQGRGLCAGKADWRKNLRELVTFFGKIAAGRLARS